MAYSILLILCMFHPQWLSLASPDRYENEFSYMNVVTDATDLPPAAEYDYIVVGGGTAGCPLATTLSQSHSVLVLERGTTPLENPSVLRADQFQPNLMVPDDGLSPVERFTSLDGVENARARILGGGTMVNAGFYSRAEPEFYQRSSIDWDPRLVDEAYRWIEDAVVFRSRVFPWQAVVRDALVEAGVGPDNGFGFEHVVGTKVSGSIFDESGRRHGAVELLSRGDFGNLRVVVRALVQRLLFSPSSSGLKAKGVTYLDAQGRPHNAFIRGTGEVILSAGALGSPQLLLLSGIGPVSELSEMLIPILSPHQHVGKFMADNPRNNIALVLSSTSLGDSYLQTVGITERYYIESSSYTATFVNPTTPSSFLGDLSSPLNFSLALFAAKVPGPASQGSLSLASPIDARVSPRVRFNYFSEEEDLVRCVEGVTKIGDILRTQALAPFKFDDGLEGQEGFKIFGPALPENYRLDKSSVEGFCRSTITTWWHYHGGCRAGKVVAGDFRVVGIDALRVVDGSVFETSPGTNPQATLMMMGRYAGLKILQQNM